MASVNTCRSSKELFALKQKAIKYYEENGVPDKMEEILNSMFYDNPPDVFGHLVNFFSQFTKPAMLQKVSARPVFDSMGMLTIQTDVYCKVNNDPKLICSSTIPNANLRVSPEEREKAELDLHESVVTAVKMMNADLSHMVSGIDPLAQKDIDVLVTEYIEEKRIQEQIRKAEDTESEQNVASQAPPSVPEDKEKRKSTKGKGTKSSASVSIIPDRPLESFAMGSEMGAALSQAVCACAAITSDIPLYRHIGNLARSKGALHEFRIPLPMVTIIQTGKHSPGKANCVKEYMVVPGISMSPDKSIEHIQQIYHHIAKSLSAKQGPNAKLVTESGALCPQFDTPNQALDLLQEAVNAQGLTIGEDMYLAINAAAHEFFDSEKGKYEVMTGQLKTPDDMVDFWADLVTKYPSLIAIIDPIRGEDSEPWLKLCERVSEHLFVIGDRFYSRPGLLKAEELPSPIQTSGIMMNLDRMTTVSDIISCANKFQELNNEIVIAANQADTTDTFIVDLAVGLNARFLKLGGPCRGERSCKLNHLIKIFDELESPEQGQEAEPVPSSKSALVTEDESVQLDLQKGSVEDKISEEREDESTKDVFDTALGKETETDDGVWGEDKPNTLKLHAPFVFPFIENPPPPSEREDEGEGTARRSSRGSKL